jgi:cytochrome c oxidase subunit II
MMNATMDALAPAGIQAERIARLWDVFLWVSVGVYVLVMVALLAALFARRAEARRTLVVVSAATGVTVAILLGLLTASIFTGRDLASMPGPALQIAVTGRQWWWQVDYDDRDKSKRVTTANELTIPVGIPVTLHLQSPDVIHSFWVPSLHGKRDLIPGRRTAMVIRADRPGVYRGQCAEFCGYQHAKMALWVHAVPPAEYARWIEASRQPSKPPSTIEQRRGLEIFSSSGCALCHTIQGTGASGKTAPELTHFASRRSIAAGSLPNRRDLLARWILDPQHVKPGNRMPANLVGARDVPPLVAYLESLR